MTLDLAHLKQAVARGPVARILVLKSAGSVPRGAGTSMLVWAEGQEGTIGGGALEWDAVHAARAQIERGGIVQRTIPLGPDLGQCCGGSVTLVTEVFDSNTCPDSLPYARRLSGVGLMTPTLERKIAALAPSEAPITLDGWLIETPPPNERPLWIWGAGHIGRALVSTLAPLPEFRIHWADIAAERFPDDIPAGVETVTAENPADLVPFTSGHAEHVIVTHSHALDLELCNRLLTHEFRFVGLIGSATKWARFRKRLCALGHRNENVARILCPIGDKSLGKHPQAIALGVATDLIRGNRCASDMGQVDSDFA